MIDDPEFLCDVLAAWCRAHRPEEHDVIWNVVYDKDCAWTDKPVSALLAATKPWL